MIKRRALVNLPNNASEKAKEENDESFRLLLLLMSVSIVFIVCNVPAAIITVLIRVYFEEYATNFSLYAFVHAANLIELANYAANFYAYSVASRDFRRGLTDVCCSGFCRKHMGEGSSDATGPMSTTSNTTIEQHKFVSSRSNLIMTRM